MEHLEELILFFLGILLAAIGAIPSISEYVLDIIGHGFILLIPFSFLIGMGIISYVLIMSGKR